MKIRCCLLLAACVASPPEAFARKWTDATMAHTIEAQFVDCVYGTVRLRRTDNSIITIPLRMLCEADHKFIRAYYSVTPASAAAALAAVGRGIENPAG